MPEPSESGVGRLREQAAEVVLATPGVARMEPTLKNALRRLTDPGQGLTAFGGGRSSTGEGLHLLQRDGVVGIAADVILDDTRSALDTADDVQQRLVRFIETHGLVAGRVSIAVLGIDDSAPAG